MRVNLKHLIMCFTTVLTACSTDEENTGYTEYTDFLNSIVLTVGEDATYCGEVEITDSPLVVNNCIVNEFENNNAFYAIHHLLGTEGQATLVVSMSPNGNLTLWNYYGGRDSDNEQVTSIECENPMVNIDLTIQYTSPFTCSNIQ